MRFLNRLHRWNAWIILILVFSGLILSIGSIRGQLGEVRVWIKEAHILIGLVLVGLLFLYLPSLSMHLKKLRERMSQKVNLGIVLILLLGWIISGIILWQFRAYPSEWVNTALVIHDFFTWVGVPYALYHTVTRLRWIKELDRKSAINEVEEQNEQLELQYGRPTITGRPVVSRRRFVNGAVGVGIVALFLPYGLRWFQQKVELSPAHLISGDTVEVNKMLPAPKPLPDSVNVIGGGASGEFRVYTVTKIPEADSKTWNFIIDGHVKRIVSWNWEQFLKFPRVVQVSDFHCVTGWSVYHNTWEGIRLSDLLVFVGVTQDASMVKFYSSDLKYTDTLTLEQAKAEDIMVAVLHDGKPIGIEYGGPVRLIVPKMYAYKSVKWLSRIEIINKEEDGYWEVRGYDRDAWIEKG